MKPLRAAFAPLLLSAVCGLAQQQHVTWNLTVQPSTAPPGGKILATVAGRIDPGWHLYSGSSPAGIPITFQAGPDNVVQSVRLFQPPPKRAFDKNFGADTETYEDEVAFAVEVLLKQDAPAGAVELTLKPHYQTCSDTQCIPARWQGTAPLTIDPASSTAAVAIPPGYTEAKPPAVGSGAAKRARILTIQRPDKGQN